MTPERFRRIEQLATLVLQQRERERTAFLDKACSGDRGLRGEVESLLASDEKAGNFLDEPAAQLVAEGCTEDSEAVANKAGTVALPITALGRYVVERELGTGAPDHPAEETGQEFRRRAFAGGLLQGRDKCVFGQAEELVQVELAVEQEEGPLEHRCGAPDGVVPVDLAEHHVAGKD